MSADPVALPVHALVWPSLGALLLAVAVVAVVALDQGALAAGVSATAADSGGLFHEFFHDARHVLGVPCH